MKLHFLVSETKCDYLLCSTIKTLGFEEKCGRCCVPSSGHKEYFYILSEISVVVSRTQFTSDLN